MSWRDRLAHLDSTREIHLAELADASQYMCVADALVTDHSSVGFEFMLLDRPVIVIDCPALLEHARVSRDKAALLRSAATVVADTAALGPAVLSSLSRPGTSCELRRAIAAKLFYRAGTATSRAVAAFYEMIELPVPATEPAAGSRMPAPALPVPMKSAQA